MNYSEKHNFISRIKKIINQKGIFYLFKKTFYKYLFPLYLIFFIKNKKFLFKNKKLKYFFHPYNLTWSNERALEIPIVYDFIKSHKEGKILEIGNVLSHYFKCKWDILDLYEKAEGVINKDVVNFSPKDKYDLIVSISTMEHVGYDEKVKDDKKILRSIKNLKQNCLKKDGIMIITWELNYNPIIDNLLFEGKFGFRQMYFFERTNWKNIWKQTTLEKIRLKEYSKPFINADALVIIIN